MFPIKNAVALVSSNLACYQKGNKITIKYHAPTVTPDVKIPWLCPSTEPTSRIANGNDAPNGTFPFFVSDGYIAGVIIHSHYILTAIQYQNSRIGYGLSEQQSIADVLDESYPYITNIVETMVLGIDEMVLARVDPPFEFSPTVQPLKISDCSGPSNPSIGITLSIFGLGRIETNAFAETMQVKCVESIADTTICANSAQIISQHFCLPPGLCFSDNGGPIVAEDGGDLYLAGVAGFVNCGKYAANRQSLQSNLLLLLLKIIIFFYVRCSFPAFRSLQIVKVSELLPV